MLRPDIYTALSRAENELASRNGIKIILDPAANSIALIQIEECIFFYEEQSLSLYMNRVNDPMAWVRHCCEVAEIPCPVEEIS